MLWEKEKMLVTSIFSFSHNVFYQRKFAARTKLSSANAFNWDKAKNVSFSKGFNKRMRYPWATIESLPHNPVSSTVKQRTFENIVGKGANAGDQHFLLFSQCFLPYQKHKSSFWLQ